MGPQEELDLVNAAIRAQLTGGVAKWTEGGHAVEALDLYTLYKRKKELETLIACSGQIFFPVREVQNESTY